MIANTTQSARHLFIETIIYSTNIENLAIIISKCVATSQEASYETYKTRRSKDLTDEMKRGAAIRGITTNL